MRKPDIVAIDIVVLNTAIIVDLCVPAVEEAFHDKVRYYDNQEIRTWIANVWDVEPRAFRFGGMVLTWGSTFEDGTGPDESRSKADGGEYNRDGCTNC